AGELRTLVDALDQVEVTGKSRRVLVLGEAGVGKSRLVDAFLEQAGARVLALSARCLPYGEGITYSPLVQLLRQAAAIGESADREHALARLQRLLGTALDGEVVARILGQVLGFVDGVASALEIAWAARRAAETLAAERPLVLLVDDLQWAEEPLVELLAGIAERGQAPILLLCLARPELELRDRAWLPELHLRPLADSDAEELMRGLVSGRALAPVARERLLAAAGGNPLFLEELVAYLDADGDPAEIPPTLDALLSAHIDTLDGRERGTLERASVEGEVFHRGAALALMDPPLDTVEVDTALVSLRSKEFVRETRSSFDGETAFRFRHLLVRDVAYRSAPKRRRAELHVRFSGWLETKLGDRLLELAEIVGYHLEQAWRLRSDLGPLDEDTIEVGGKASELLAGAARRALARADGASALNLFTRASELAATPQLKLGLELERGVAAREAGDFALASAALGAVIREAAALDARGVAARAAIELALIRHHTEPGAIDEVRRVAEAALATFEELGDEHGLAVALTALAEERWVALRCAEMEELLERALVHAERAGDERLIAGVVISLARAVLFGPDPASAAAARCEQLLERARRIGPTVEASLSMMLAVLEAAQGREERSRELSQHSTSVLRELASGPRVAVAGQYAGLAALILGDAMTAERELRASYELLDRLGERAIASTVTALLARALVDLGRHAEAEELCALSLEWADPGDLASQAYARSAWACALVARGAGDEAKRHARDAVELSAASDFTNQRGDAYFDLALVLRACGETDAARAAATAALELYEAKENSVSAARVKTLATTLG
ncbi:MAG: hypothetical protein QOE29_1314, partial [Gaiellaceae bacterium]|nr:hypothetical protein [Gaiellaceae bacterium]